jgi:ubiquinone/menaquinone biosynthesis C-methylase UbiE
MDSDLNLQQRPNSLLPKNQESVCILDVGAGPLTFLGKRSPGKNLSISAVDPLAEEYDKLLKKYKVQPNVRTKYGDAERLHRIFPSNSFDLVFARNCIDHSYNPEKAVLCMIEVAKKGCYILLEHIANEAENENYQGLHQWNFSADANGDFLISSKSKVTNMTQKHSSICKITCEMVDEGKNGQWLINRILKL